MSRRTTLAVILLSAACRTLAFAQGAPAAPEPLPHPKVPAPPPISPGLPLWVYILGGVILIAAVGLLMGLLFAKKSKPPAVPARPLHAAMRAMKDLRNRADVLSPSDVGHGVSEILRRYYMDRYGIPAPFRTTQELFPNVGRNDEPLRRRMWRDRFESLASLYDSLAYAPLPATRSEAIALVETAISKLEEERLHENTLAA